MKLATDYRDKREKQCCSGSHKQFKTLFEDHMVRLKVISLYIYKDLRVLRSNESREHYHEDDNLVPSPRCGFSFEAAFQLLRYKINIFRIHKKCYFPVKFVVFPFIFAQDFKCKYLYFVDTKIRLMPK